MGTLLGKLVFQLHFYYLYSLKKLKWSAKKGCCKRMGLYHFTEGRKEPRTICSSKVASRYNYFNTISYLPKLIVG